ncbi:MAG: serine hydrolase [Balneolaceae bacterium]|nr:serine hydrolase [Balneolaceae bacterium]
MKRAFKFIIIYVAVAAAIFALVIGINYSAFDTLFENSESMAEGSEYIENTYSLKDLSRFIGEHPEYISITSYNVNNPDSGIFYNEETPRSLGATSNLLLLMEYERQVKAGLLNPDQLISLNDIKTFALPEISENNHQKIIDAFESGDVPLDEAVKAMIENSDLVVADYLWFLLGEKNIRAMADSLNIPASALAVPFSGLYITINPSLSDTASLSGMELPRIFDAAIDNALQLRNDPEFNKRVKQQFEDDRLSLTFMQERDALSYFPQASTKFMADLMFRLYNDQVFSPLISQNVKKKLRWPMGSEPIARSFKDYGAIYDNRMGLLAGLDFGTSVYDDHTSVQAVFFDRLPVAFWVHMSANHMQEDYQQRLIWDPALYGTTQKDISKANHE